MSDPLVDGAVELDAMYALMYTMVYRWLSVFPNLNRKISMMTVGAVMSPAMSDRSTRRFQRRPPPAPSARSN